MLEPDLLCKTKGPLKFVTGWTGTKCPQQKCVACASHGSHRAVTCLYVNHFSLGYQMSFPRPFRTFGGQVFLSLRLLRMLMQRQLFHSTPSTGWTKSRQRLTSESVATIYGIILWSFSNSTATLCLPSGTLLMLPQHTDKGKSLITYRTKYHLVKAADVL